MTISPSPDDAGKELRAFRYRKDALRELEKAAKGMGIPVNQLVNDCVVEGLIHITLRRGAQAMTLSRQSVVKILSLIENIDEIIRVGGEVGDSLPMQLYAVHDVEPSWDSVLFALDQVHGKSCGWFEFKYHSHYDRTGKELHRLIFIHDAGIRWTAFIEGYITKMLKRLLKVESKVIAATDTMLEVVV